jgi:hypothetical protein
VTLGRLQARRGDPGAAATLQEAGERAFPTGELQWVGPVAAARAEHAWLRGESDRVAEEATRAFGMAVQARQPWFAGELAMRLWQVDALPEIPAVAAEPYRLLLADDWRAAADAWQALGCPYERAEALVYGGRRGRPGGASAAGRARRRPGGPARTQPAGSSGSPRGPSRTTASNPAGLTDPSRSVQPDHHALVAGQVKAALDPLAVAVRGCGQLDPPPQGEVQAPADSAGPTRRRASRRRCSASIEPGSSRWAATFTAGSPSGSHGVPVVSLAPGRSSQRIGDRSGLRPRPGISAATGSLT